ncbi:MAG: DUF2075 domain-containing protein [Gammaproteobacteria bacterium]|nr:DUF2075 domain-containing protein [Gammaproteobacteria bacterium]
MTNHAWSGPLPDLVEAEPADLLRQLKDFVPDASAAQVAAWEQELEVLKSSGAAVLRQEQSARNHGAVLEYMLPREAGRRPDVVVLQNGLVVVLEFKETGRLRRSDIDQTAAYARDLQGYHTACEHAEVVPVLVLCGDSAVSKVVDGVRVVRADEMATLLVVLARSSNGPIVPTTQFLQGEYAPLPTLVTAARLLFDNMPLPHIKRARSAGVADAVVRILDDAREVRTAGRRRLILVTGVPGAGKTLVGLQVAHSAALEAGFEFGGRRKRGAPATFLSGNGPLVQVLQNALKSTAFVQDMHRFIREHGLEHPDRIPTERVIVFDEAQRAWDRPKIEDFYSKKLPGVDTARFGSEPELLVRIADSMPEGAVVIALVGQGQEIHTGEEGGMTQWADAVRESPGEWSVLGPPELTHLFEDCAFEADPLLDLDVGLRYHAAADLHRWVELVLDDGNLDAAKVLAERLRHAAFPIYVTRDLDAAKNYVLSRFQFEPLRRYGLLASSKSEKHLAAFGLATGFQSTKRIRIGDWFNAPPEDARSCCQFNDVITEFQCQGLELDMAITCWASDLWWNGERWESAAARKNKLVRDAHQLRLNAYRVLLTRGREGIVIYVPTEPAPKMDAVVSALLAAGALEAR